MFFSWRRKARPSTSLSRSRAHRPYRVRLTLEPLEERMLPQGVPLMVTTNADSGPGSLRQAITTANGQTGTTTIDFAIGSGSQTIAVASPLPAITAPVFLDGTSQPGYSGTPLILLTQTSTATGVTSGLKVNSSGCTVQGLMITGFTSGDGITVAASNDTIGGTQAGAGNVISGNGQFGVLLAGASGALIQNNKIGTDAIGTVALSNGFDGIYVLGATRNTIAGNLLSGNGRFGVFLLGEQTTNGVIPSTGNLVEDNIIGLGQGAGELGNTDDGVALFAGAIDNTIGGTTAGAGNLISGNRRFGVYLNGSGTSGNLIQGNRIGTSVDATFGQGNSLDGIAVFAGPSNNTIGGMAAGAGNVISGNGRDGIFLANAGAGNGALGNFIGTSGDGKKAVGNSGTGVALEAVTGATLGGTAAGAGNVISGNTEGVVLIGAGAAANLLQGNLIGTDKSGSAALGNTVFGVDIQGGASGNILGGTASGAGNTIAHNGRTGVVVGNSAADTTTSGNSILGNSIFGNVFLGIDLGNDGTTANTPGGPHLGPNHLQNFPTIRSAVASGSGTAIALALNSALAHTFRIEAFADAAGPGRTFLGAASLFTDPITGNGSTTLNVPTAITALVGQHLTATATDQTTGDTSELTFPAFVVAAA